MNLKPIALDAVPRALELAERYRLLNEPEQAASICYDVLNVDPQNMTALRTLFLAITEQFGQPRGSQLADADKVALQIGGDYEHAYYEGIARERWARAELRRNAHVNLVRDFLRSAMLKYEAAEACRPEGNYDAQFRWNACARLLEKIPGHHEREHDHHPGD